MIHYRFLGLIDTPFSCVVWVHPKATTSLLILGGDLSPPFLFMRRGCKQRLFLLCLLLQRSSVHRLSGLSASFGCRPPSFWSCPGFQFPGDSGGLPRRSQRLALPCCTLHRRMLPWCQWSGGSAVWRVRCCGSTREMWSSSIQRLAYLCNMYVNPYVDRYFKNKNTKDGTNIGIDRDYYALATMLQWVWRSCIRDDKPIEIYIPSTRIRTLFMKWLDDEMWLTQGRC